ncbi:MULTISPECIES: exonuclease domain-containing protein [Streptomyces]|uniref:3'-5' exonuclease n=1 Tax=Streptomyces koyangensis TaxID=188770 RepID=A0A385D7H9_9ACTN|nr:MULTISPECIES: exonuclease domain-containing protein [Streptomyces]WTD06290.1 exonuclease domain-containing protein [Streptomyces albidoflavus]AXQ54019.1 3'-5' exonuclease [Streptomyces koyangensis]OWA19743.1 DNA polymerase III subunit epsilon [Streptomyces sp. CS227]PKR41945.1 DNA polymerase III subunit epsilon [Streptomyces sp. EAG2]RZF04717.1 DNA polymerase III subunit epsilon [Streptomyces sp. SCA2-2]
MGWHRELLIGFDLETTGTDPREARIVTAAVIEVADGERRGHRTWLADPGIPIPAGATAVHGITDARAAAEGSPPDRVADAVAEALTGYWRAGVPVVAYNAPFDLTLLAAELRRHRLPSLAERLGGAPVGPVIDPLTVDRAVDRYRKGSRRLSAVCAEYGVALEDAHDASADALAAARLARAIALRHPKVAALGPAALHERQIAWAAERAADFQAYLRRKGERGAVVDGGWPLHAEAA